MPLGFGRGSGVAVLELHGVIGTQMRIPAYSRILENVAKNKRYRALLVDIDSPGGSAAGSEVLYRGLRRVAESKPVYAYVRGMGASGGYYVACAASRVFALPTALVGSIGVIYLRPVLEQLLEKMGVEFSIFKGGRLKDMSGFWRSPTPEESEKFQGLIDEIYDNFVSVVARSRSLEDSAVRELATGEVMTAARGIDLGLIDQIGDFEDAAAAVALAGGVRRPRLKWLQPRRSLGQRPDGRPRHGGLMGKTEAATGAAGLTEVMQRVLSGGIYFLEPSHLAGYYSPSG